MAWVLDNDWIGSALIPIVGEVKAHMQIKTLRNIQYPVRIVKEKPAGQDATAV